MKLKLQLLRKELKNVNEGIINQNRVAMATFGTLEKRLSNQKCFQGVHEQLLKCLFKIYLLSLGRFQTM